MHEGDVSNTRLFMIAHVFFVVVFVALLWAFFVVVRKRRDWKSVVLAGVPLALIFVTTYFATRFPYAHQTTNYIYDAWLIFNTYYFWKSGPRLLGILYLVAVMGTLLDFAMHFVIRALS